MCAFVCVCVCVCLCVCVCVYVCINVDVFVYAPANNVATTLQHFIMSRRIMKKR